MNMHRPFFSICIPNFNYALYIGKTISSVLAQTFDDFEIVISDNASTDNSVEVIRSFADPRIRFQVNQNNVGFAGNLDRAGAMANGKYMIMLSSDDLMTSRALATYAQLLDKVESTSGESLVVTSPPEWIDGEDRSLGYSDIDRKFWSVGRLDEELSNAVGAPVLAAEAAKVLSRALALLRNPLPFAPTCYPRSLYQAVEGYGAGRMMNPDKWFSWKLLGAARHAYLVDTALFQYRWHSNNQTAQQSKTGSIKHLADQYANTLEVPADLLQTAGLARAEIVAAFVENDIALRNLERLAEGHRSMARRGLHFGMAVYPSECSRNWKVWVLRAMLLLGPAGSLTARLVKDRAHARWAIAQGGTGPQQLRAK
jgi:glycosyltransferase involved in cell wall biosynthesis